MCVGVCVTMLVGKLMFKLKSLPFDHSGRFVWCGTAPVAAIREIVGWIKVGRVGAGWKVTEVCFIV